MVRAKYRELDCLLCASRMLDRMVRTTAKELVDDGK